MAATGYFNKPLGNTLLTSSRVIYKAPATSPTTAATFPTNRLPATQTPAPRPTAPTQVFPVNVDPGGNTPQPVSPSGPGGFVPSGPSQPGPTAEPPANNPPPTTGGETPAPSGSDTSRLLDLLAGAFKPQDIQQGYAPQAVSSDAMQSGGGTNPMAILVLAIMAIIGVVWWTHRKGRA